MSYVRKDYDEAERLSRKALELDPADTRISRDFEGFRKAHRT